ncbi:MAG: WbqC family protein [bacterium]
MIICGHQPNFLPYAGFFHKMMNCDRFVLVDNVEFVGKGEFGWIHRNKIRIHNKDEHWLTVPVLQKGRYHQDINEVEINNDEPWRRKHWKAIYLNYKDAPYFDNYADELEQIYEQEWEKLVNLNIRLLKWARNCLNIDVPMTVSSDEGITGESTQLVINLTKDLGGDRYLSGMHGRDYLDRELIEQSDVTVEFQDYEPVEYPQQQDGFVPYLSIVDILFNCGPDSRDVIEEGGSITDEWE